jgi:hypothetical protein
VIDSGQLSHAHVSYAQVSSAQVSRAQVSRAQVSHAQPPAIGAQPALTAGWWSPL